MQSGYFWIAPRSLADRLYQEGIQSSLELCPKPDDLGLQWHIENMIA